VNADLTLDVMPLDGSVLGFSNIWYRGALKAAQPARLPSGAVIRLITAPYFLGTKMEAFRGRGARDFFGSHDLEDFIAVIEGRDWMRYMRTAKSHCGHQFHRTLTPKSSVSESRSPTTAKASARQLCLIYSSHSSPQRARLEMASGCGSANKSSRSMRVRSGPLVYKWTASGDNFLCGSARQNGPSR